MLTALEQLHLLESDLDAGRDPRTRVIAAGAALDRAREFCRVPEPAALVARERRTVLLVDADQEGLHAGRRCLESLGCRVITAASGESALVDFQALRGCLELVVLQSDLPGMSGAMVAGRMRELDARVPVAVAGAEAEARLSRPLQTEELRALLKELGR